MPRNPTPESFREIVESRAQKAGTTDEDRATALGVSRQTLDTWRKSKADLRISQLAKLAEASGLPLALYFDPDSTKQPDPIDWARLVKWLDSITEMVLATEPPPDPILAEIHDDVHGGTPHAPLPGELHPKATRHPLDTPTDNGK